MTQYAKKSSVSPQNTRNDIEKTLVRYGAEGFAYGWQGKNVMIGFMLRDRRMQFVLPLPDMGNNKQKYEQEIRSKWRALFLIIKAKLEAVESGITTLEDEFLAHIVLPGGETVGDWMKPQIDEAYRIGAVPKLLQIGKFS